MFSFFKKPIGIYLRDEGLTLVRLKKGRRVPVLQDVIKKPLPAGAIVDGLIEKPNELLPVLRALRAGMDSNACTVSLPASRSYSGILRVPSELSGKAMDQLIKNQIDTVLPSAASEMYYEHYIIPSKDKKEHLVFVVGIEKSLLDSYKSVFAQAGWTRVTFVLENLALAKAIPIKFSKYPAVMFMHSFGASTLMSSVYEGNAFDGFMSKDLKEDFVKSYNSFVQQLGHAPTHIIVSGDKDGLAPLAKVVFKNGKPKFISAQFLIKYEGAAQEGNDLIVATGLSLIGDLCSKRSGLCLLNLLD